MIHEIADVIMAHATRVTDLEGDKRMRYALIFKNHREKQAPTPSVIQSRH